MLMLWIINFTSEYGWGTFDLNQSLQSAWDTKAANSVNHYNVGQQILN